MLETEYSPGPINTDELNKLLNEQFARFIWKKSGHTMKFNNAVVWAHHGKWKGHMVANQVIWDRRV